MKNRNSLIKYLIFGVINLLVIFILFATLSSYFFSSKLSIHNILSFDILKKYNGEEFTFDEKFIDKNKIVNVSEKNNINTVTYSYNLNITDIDKKIDYITINYNDKNVISYEIKFYSQKDVIFLNSKNIFNLDDDSQFAFIDDNIEKIEIKASYDVFGGTQQNDDSKIVDNINYINVNNIDDYNIVKKKVILKSFFIICFIYLLVFFVSKMKYISLYRFKNYKIDKICFWLIIILGSIISFLYPLYQIPDELTHINMTYKEMNYENISFNDSINNYADSGSITRNPNKRVNAKEYFNLKQKLNIKLQKKIPSVRLIRHLPQSLALYLGMIFNFPVLIVITLAEFLALLFYAFCCKKAINLMPFKKEILMMIMLLPVCLQQMGSFSYDVVLNSFCFILFAYIMHIKFTKERFDIKDVIILTLLNVSILLIKPPYVLISLLALLIPLNKYNIEIGTIRITRSTIEKNKKILSLMMLVLLLLIMLLCYKVLPKIEYGKVLLALVYNIPITIKMFINTLQNYFSEYVISIWGNLGWFDLRLSNIFVIFSIICFVITCFNNYNEKDQPIGSQFKKLEIISIFGVSLLIFFIVIISLIPWTFSVSNLDISSMTYKDVSYYYGILAFVGGVQGRYFIPILPLIVLPIFNKKVSIEIGKLNPRLLQFFYYIILFGYMIYSLLIRYWIK